MKIILNGKLTINENELRFNNMSINIEDIEVIEKTEDSSVNLLDSDYNLGIDKSLINDINNIGAEFLDSQYPQDIEYVYYDEEDIVEMLNDYTELMLDGDMSPQQIYKTLESMINEIILNEDYLDD